MGKFLAMLSLFCPFSAHAADSSFRRVFVKNEEVFTSEAGSERKQITHDGIPRSPRVWSKGGSKIAFLRAARAELELTFDRSGGKYADLWCQSCLFVSLPKKVTINERPVLPARRTRTVRRLRVEDFPKLPSGVAAVLRSHDCTIPQPNQDGPVRNVIHGEFFGEGQRGWAVLCSSAGRSSILVFRNDNDSKPDEIAESQDDHYLIDSGLGGTLYSREISTVDREFIVSHYRAYGGAEPPPIDHNGIDDAFLEKASITWYSYNGGWMQLQGQD